MEIIGLSLSKRFKSKRLMCTPLVWNEKSRNNCIIDIINYINRNRRIICVFSRFGMIAFYRKIQTQYPYVSLAHSFVCNNCFSVQAIPLHQLKWLVWRKVFFHGLLRLGKFDLCYGRLFKLCTGNVLLIFFFFFVNSFCRVLFTTHLNKTKIKSHLFTFRVQKIFSIGFQFLIMLLLKRKSLEKWNSSRIFKALGLPIFHVAIFLFPCVGAY